MKEATDGPEAEVLRRVVQLAGSGVGVREQRRAIAAVLDRREPPDPTQLIARLHAEHTARGARADRQRQSTAGGARRAATHLALSDGVRVLVPGAPGYPEALRRAWPDLGAPLWLFASGSPALCTPDPPPAAAVVGTRHPTAGGLRIAEELGAALAAAGAVVVSGMARGIDQAAHRGALSVGGMTCGVLGTGFGVDYPRGSARLRAAVADSGGLFTELAAGEPPRPQHFLARNRIISGLCVFVVVVEGRARSGALHTARMAVSQGRDVWAVPGPPGAVNSEGPLGLIRDGAQVVTRICDVVEALGLDDRPRAQVVGDPGAEAADAGRPALDAVQRRVHELLGPVPVSVDELVRRSGLAAAPVMAALSQLHRLGLVDDGPHGFCAAG